MKLVELNFPTKVEIEEAHERIKNCIVNTPIKASEELNKLVGCSLYFKCENLQKANAFKSRGAFNALLTLSKADADKGVCAHSSGNHAQALARAAFLLKIKSYIVMPSNSPETKVKAVKKYQQNIHFCEPTLQAREQKLKSIVDEFGAVEIHPYDNHQVICGQATASKEIFESGLIPDIIMTPVGGGGLLSGTALWTKYSFENVKVYGAEPEGADDAFKSFYSEEFQPSIKPNTVADGLLTSLGKKTFPIILKNVDEIYLASEDNIARAMQLIHSHFDMVIEPSSAVPLAAILQHKNQFANKTIAIILSGGNIDLQGMRSIYQHIYNTK